jgi:hypothetical protein
MTLETDRLCLAALGAELSTEFIVAPTERVRVDGPAVADETVWVRQLNAVVKASENASEGLVLTLPLPRR